MKEVNKSDNTPLVEEVAYMNPQEEAVSFHPKVLEHRLRGLSSVSYSDTDSDDNHPANKGSSRHSRRSQQIHADSSHSNHIDNNNDDNRGMAVGETAEVAEGEDSEEESDNSDDLKSLIKIIDPSYRTV